MKRFENNIDTSHHADTENPEWSSEDLHETKNKEPERPKRTGCKNCNKNGSTNSIVERTIEQAKSSKGGCKKCGQNKKNNIDDLPLG